MKNWIRTPYKWIQPKSTRSARSNVEKNSNSNWPKLIRRECLTLRYLSTTDYITNTSNDALKFLASGGRIMLDVGRDYIGVITITIFWTTISLFIWELPFLDALLDSSHLTDFFLSIGHFLF